MTDQAPGPSPRPIPRRVVLGAVAVASLASWVVAVLVGRNAWRLAFGAGSRAEGTAGQYLVLALFASALAALPFTFLQWVDPDQKQRWRSIGGAVGVAGSLIFAALWFLR